jgi:negative regulator of replication initiation
MKTIEVDDEVFAYLQGNAIPYVETPNLTLRRLFKMNGSTPSSEATASHQPVQYGIRGKEQKADLPTLIRAGLLREGQKMFLLDYQGRKIERYEAIVSGKALLWHNNIYSMSELAKICLKKEGFRSESVRGPAHWSNYDGITVKDLWNRYLSKKKTG